MPNLTTRSTERRWPWRDQDEEENDDDDAAAKYG